MDASRRRVLTIIGIVVLLLAAGAYIAYRAQPTQDERLAACYDRLLVEQPELEAFDRAAQCIDITGYDADR